jgi:hypothetical protein
MGVLFCILIIFTSIYSYIPLITFIEYRYEAVVGLFVCTDCIGMGRGDTISVFYILSNKLTH